MTTDPARRPETRATSAAAFETFAETVLVLKLRGDEIPILGNLSSHKSSQVAALINSNGAEIRFVPPFSTDLNPIESIFSQLKAYFRSAAVRTLEQLWNAISAALRITLPVQFNNCFKACGYRVT